MKKILFILFSLTLATPALGEDWSLTAAQWAMPKSGTSLVQMPGLKAAVDALIEDPGAALLIQYPGGDEGALWAEELKAWMIALGIGSDRLRLLPGSPSADKLLLKLEQ